MFYKLIISLIIVTFLQSCDFEVKKDDKLLKISATGVGEISVKPDVIEFDFTIRKIDKNVNNAIEEMSNQANQAIEILQKNSVEENDIKTISYNVAPKYEYPKPICENNICQRQEMQLIGYEVLQRFNVKLRKFDNISSILSDLGTIKITEIGNLQFNIDNIDEIKKQARSKAIEIAKKDAKIIAQDLGVEIDKIIDFQENNYPIYQERAYLASNIQSRAKSTVDLSIMAGENIVKSSVTLTFKIK